MSDRPVPERIQRKRVKGWRMPTGSVYVGRPTQWGNPYPVGCVVAYRKWGVVEQFTVDTPRESVALYRRWLSDDLIVPLSGFNAHLSAPTLPQVRLLLAGKDLVCWCPIEDPEGRRVPCHADVLLEIANGGAS
jgi:hypothetical protein